VQFEGELKVGDDEVPDLISRDSARLPRTLLTNLKIHFDLALNLFLIHFQSAKLIQKKFVDGFNVGLIGQIVVNNQLVLRHFFDTLEFVECNHLQEALTHQGLPSPEYFLIQIQVIDDFADLVVL